VAARLAGDAGDAAGRVDVGEAVHGASDQLLDLVGLEVADLAVDDGDEPVGPGAAEAVERVGADEEEADLAEAVAGGAKEVEERRRRPAFFDAGLEALDLVDGDEDAVLAEGRLDRLEPREGVGPVGARRR
jgi:hypothetical protein